MCTDSASSVPGRNLGKGADSATGRDGGPVDAAHGFHGDGVAQCRIPDDASCTDVDAFAQGDGAFEHHADVDHAVATRAQAATDIDPIRVHQGDALRHEFVR